MQTVLQHFALMFIVDRSESYILLSDGRTVAQLPNASVQYVRGVMNETVRLSNTYGGGRKPVVTYSNMQYFRNKSWPFQSPASLRAALLTPFEFVRFAETDQIQSFRALAGLLDLVQAGPMIAIMQHAMFFHALTIAMTTLAGNYRCSDDMG
eukprot:COSAG02_NODE_6133_length_3778_cov_5.507747_5_plen_152_part_00